MYEDRSALNASMEAAWDFPRFLRQMRREKNVSLEQLSEGLMTVSQLARIERGHHSACKNAKDRLLGRLGISSELYENLLNIEDYEAWEQQHNILCAIEQKEFQKAQEMIVAYEQKKPSADRDKLKQQFCLVMRAEILRQQGADQSEIGDCYERAVKLTISDGEHLCISQKLLSVQEVNLVLEYEFYHKGADFADKCRELMMYVENSIYDDLSKTKIYSKIAYYYLRELSDGQSGRIVCDMGERLKICNRAIQMLRNVGRAYYLMELLEMKNQILVCMGNDLREHEKVLEWEKVQAVLQESIEFADLLKKLYAAYDASAYMQDCTYLYQQRCIFYIGDVLRTRRTMYGLTQQELCAEVCSVKTLRRTERRKANMQREVAGILLGKLGLSKEFQQVHLALDDSEVLRLEEELSVCHKNQETERDEEVLKMCKEKFSEEMSEYFLQLWRRGELNVNGQKEILDSLFGE